MTYNVVISSYKYGHLAAHCIESVLCQNKQFDEVWFVDDAGGDCFHLNYLYGDRVNFVHRTENLGTVDNFQDMLNRIDSDYVMFLGADNWLRSDALEKLSSLCDSRGKVITYDIMVTGELRDEIYIPYKDDCYLKEGDICWKRENKHHGSMLYDVELAKTVGGYSHNGGKRSDEDLNLWDKLVNAGVSVSYLPEALLYYRRHKQNFNKYGYGGSKD